MQEITGWLLDVYTHLKNRSTCLWIIQTDPRRVCLRHTLPAIFYIGGPPETLAQAESYIYA